ncbi:MAG TPA: DNA primase [Gemmataceae bacterium]|nr:DNA primase [Gemmataceae bacterium]
MADDRVALVKQANDIVDVVGGYVALRPAGQKFKGLCPFHDDQRPSFDVDPRYQRFICWACGKKGDVITFIQEHERVNFREALELLARRAGITLEKKADSPQNRGRAFMLDVMRWAADLYQRCLLESPLAENARHYLGERGLVGETVRRFGLGFAPGNGDWLVQHAANAGIADELLVTVGLIAARKEGNGHYDFFRDRVMFPIRDGRAQTIAFGGRILPSSPAAATTGKYINSRETPLFVKSEHLYGLDQARQPAAKAGYVAVVEGYMDVLMAHQAGIANIVAPLGTAMNARHVQNLRRVGVPKVVLVFDADAGGSSGVDRALEVFVSQEVDLAIATLPQGLDPCDLLVQQGADAFRAVLDGAVNALDYKLNQVVVAEAAAGIEGKRRAADAVLGVIALAPEMAGSAGAIRQQLIVTRITQRLALKEESVWARLHELRTRARARERKGAVSSSAAAAPPSPPAPEERELLQVLLAEPALVRVSAGEIHPEAIQHPAARQLLEELYRLQAEDDGLADLPAERAFDLLRARIEDPRLAELAHEMRTVGLQQGERAAWLERIVEEFHRKHRLEPERQEIKNQLRSVGDDSAALELLRRLQTTT